MRPPGAVRFYDFDRFRIDVRRRRLLRDGEPVPIPPKALDTLLVLVANRGRLVEKEELMSRLWPDTAVEEANLTQNIFLVRRALGEAPGEPKFIATRPRRGYQFVAEIEEVTDEPAGSHGDPYENVASPRQHVRADGSDNEPRTGRRFLVPIMIAAGLSVFVIVTFWSPRGKEFARKVTDIVGPTTVTHREPVGLAKRRPVNPEAYDFYIRARHSLTRREFRKSLEYAQRALTLDPSFAAAYAAVAETYAVTLGGDLGRPSETRPRLKAAAQKALELDPDLIDAQVALAATTMAHDWNWREGERALQRILARSPNHESAQLWYAWLLEGLGRHTEALALYERAMQADPLSMNTNNSLAASLRLLRRHREALDLYRRVLDADPAFAWAHRGLGLTYLEMGLHEQGVSALEEAARLAPENASIVASLGHAYGVRGRRTEANTLLRNLDRRSSERYTSPVFAAMIHAGLGEREAAFARLEEAYRERDPIVTRVNVDPLLTPLRADARFSQLVKRLNLPLR